MMLYNGNAFQIRVCVSVCVDYLFFCYREEKTLPRRTEIVNCIKEEWNWSNCISSKFLIQLQVLRQRQAAKCSRWVSIISVRWIFAVLICEKFCHYIDRRPPLPRRGRFCRRCRPRFLQRSVLRCPSLCCCPSRLPLRPSRQDLRRRPSCRLPRCPSCLPRCSSRQGWVCWNLAQLFWRQKEQMSYFSCNL